MVRTLADANLDDNDRKLLQDIQDEGWHIVGIPPEDGTPGWAFTVGLYHSFKHPEIVVFGLPIELLGQVIGGIGSDVKEGKAFELSKEYEEILEGVRCTFRPVLECWYRSFLGYARWFYRGSQFPVLQCLWPDKEQHYPWEPKFKEAWKWAQPLLYEEDMVEARAVDLMRSVGDWKFADPPNVITITTRQVVKQHKPILVVVHEADKVAWQFLHGGPVKQKDAMIVSLGAMLKLDPTLEQLADLPEEWQAEREAVGEPWKRSERPAKEE
jgi:hypothetical protein